MARTPKDSIGDTPLEVFIPAPGHNPDDPNDAERDIFLQEAQQLLDAGLDIAVYSTDTYPSAFTDCEPVADQIAMNGSEVLPILLVEGLVKVSFMYPTVEQMRRFSHFGEVKQPKVNAAAAACGTGGADAPPTVPVAEPAGFAAVLTGVTPRPAGGPDIGHRVNLMGGHSDTTTEDSAPTASSAGGGCCGGGCGCGH